MDEDLELDVALGLGHATTLDELDEPDVDEDLEDAVARARAAGGIELELAVGFVRVRRAQP